MRVPAVFVPHGAGPCFFMDWKPAGEWDPLAKHLREFVGKLEEKPKALLFISAHWESPTCAITKPKTGSPPDAATDLIYDYYGFPPHTYELTWPARGDADLSTRIASLFQERSIPCELSERGFDHGVFIPGKLMCPEADIPTVSLSLVAGLDPEAHRAIGEALEPLRDEGVLLIGSGMSFHNIPKLKEGSGSATGSPESENFDAWLTGVIEGDPGLRGKMLQDWKKAPSALVCHPREEHLAPLFVIAGAAPGVSGRKTFSSVAMGARVSAFEFA